MHAPEKLGRARLLMPLALAVPKSCPMRSATLRTREQPVQGSMRRPKRGRRF